MTLENHLVQPPTQSSLNHIYPEISIIKSKIKWHPKVSAAIFISYRSWSKNT